MKELANIVAAWDTVCREGEEALLATVVGVSGSTYRRPGARMLLTRDGWAAGSISGGCLEGDILKKAWWRTETGPSVVTYDSTAEEDIVWGFGLGCNGIVQVLLERVSPSAPGPLSFLSSCLLHRQSGVIATVTQSQGNRTRVGERLTLSVDGETQGSLSDEQLTDWVREEARAVLGGEASRTVAYARHQAEVFLELVQPPPPLVIFGTGHDVVPLVRIAKELGWHITVVDARATRPRPERFPSADTVAAYPPEQIAARIDLTSQTAAVVMTHNYHDDQCILKALLQSPVGYIGQLGPRARTERLLAEISDDGFAATPAHLIRLHGPVGLDIGADNPEEIALSIIAEIQAARAGRSGNSLRERQASLHSRSINAFTQNVSRETASCSLSD